MRILRLSLFVLHGLYNKSRILKVAILNIDTFTPTGEGQDKTVGLKGKKIKLIIKRENTIICYRQNSSWEMYWAESPPAWSCCEERPSVGYFQGLPACLFVAPFKQILPTYLSDDPTNRKKILWTWSVQGNNLQTVWCIMRSWLVQSCYNPTESWSSTRFAKLCLHHLVLGH